MASSRQTSSAAIEHVAAKLGRAAAGALVFALPMLMTMEMWWLGLYMERPRILLLVVLTIPLLVGLSYHSGFEDTFRWNEDLRDALIALGIGALASALALWLFGIITAHSTPNEIVGKIALQMVPASIGALLARSQLGGTKGDRDRKKSPPSYAGELFLMAVGALFLALNVAPTEEMILIAYKISPAQEVALAIVSLLVMHAFVYSVNFHGGSHPPPASSFSSLFFRYTVTGYAIVLLVSAYALWTFGRLDGVSLQEVLSAAVVLGFPAAVGAAGARLII